MAKKTTLQEFEAVYPKLEQTLLDHVKAYKLPKAETEWFKTVRAHPPLQALLIFTPSSW